MEKTNNQIVVGIDKSSARYIGAFFLIAMVASLAGGGIVETIMTASKDFTAIAEQRGMLVVGILLELTNAVAVIGITVFMYPVFKKFSLRLAAAYLTFRISEVIFCSFMVISPLSLMKLSEDLLATDGANMAYWQGIKMASLAERGAISSLLVPLFFCLGATVFYVLLYKTRLVPQFISLWGMVAVVLILAMNVMVLVQTSLLNTTVMAALALPIIANEVFLGIWLMVKGFNLINIKG